MKKVLIVGSGGREHALGWSIAQNPDVSEVLYAKGNPGTEIDEKCRNVNIDGTKKDNFEKLADFVEKEDVSIIVVGPEQPLVDGIVDFFYNKGFYNLFGPTSKASIIESDKFYSYNLMLNLNIPQAESILCNTKDFAKKSIESMASDKGMVIKARGLTGGKGVYVCDSKEEALYKIEEHANNYGPYVLIAERLFGQEFSVFGISDGERVVPLEISVQDHKLLLDGDKGPNTGGMGAYCPVPIADVEIVRKVVDEMMTPVVKKMREHGREYKGFLYSACIMTEDGPKILEYNCRFGDPEAQPLVMMLKDGLHKPISSALEGRLDKVNIEYKTGSACCIVMASNGYPGSYKKGFKIGGLEDVAKLNYVKVFHAGTIFGNNWIITNGGRVLGVTAYSTKGIKDAQERAYEVVSIIDKSTKNLNSGKKVFIFRKDIAFKALR